MEPLGMTEPEGEGRLGTEAEPEGEEPPEPPPGRLHPVSHSMMMISMVMLMSIPVQPPRKAASSARASQDRRVRLSPASRRERAPRRLTLSRARTSSVKKPVRSTRRPVTTSTEASAVTATESQSRITALSSTPREQLESVSHRAREVRRSRLRPVASLPSAQAFRAARTLTSMSTETSASRKAAMEAIAPVERTPDSSTRTSTEAPTEREVRASVEREPMATRSAPDSPLIQARTEALREALRAQSEPVIQARREALTSACKLAMTPPPAQRFRPALTSTSRSP